MTRNAFEVPGVVEALTEAAIALMNRTDNGLPFVVVGFTALDAQRYAFPFFTRDALNAFVVDLCKYADLAWAPNGN